MQLKLIWLSILAFSFAGTMADAQSLKIPYVSLSPTACPLWIAHEAGYFKKHNVNAELVYIPGGSLVVQSVLSGDVNVANMAPPAAIGAWARGADLTLIASGVDQLLETVVTSPRITKPADLKGKKVGVGRYGSLTDMALRAALRHYKLIPDKDVIIVQTGGEETRLVALKSEVVDGAMLSGDKKIIAEQLGFHVTIDLSQLPIFYPVNGMIAAKKFVAGNPEQAKNFLKAWVEGIKTFKTDRDTSLKVLAKYLKITDRGILEKSYEIYRPVYKRVPYGDSKAVKFALDQMIKDVPNGEKLRAENFIDNHLLAELEQSGFIDQIYAGISLK
jgi:ABC-type nitrate/sulfonate/bicarbonate transport system substrate-binding protein